MENQVISVNLPADIVKKLQESAEYEYEVGARLSTVIADIIKAYYERTNHD